MNPRHAAALALVGWYLMMPGRTTSTPGFWQHDDKGWTHKATFDTKVECNREILKGCGTINQNGEVIGRVGPLCYSQSISSDDPRLKEK
jgi:hypothetical protein